jgi:glycosyltransferase involved in cell wall biosynthesis
VKVALYHPWVYLKSGIERMFVETLDRSRHDWTIYTHHHEPDATYPGLGRHRVVELAPPVSVRRELGPLVHAAVTMARTRFPIDGEDVLLVSSEGLGDLVLARTKLPSVAYCHTPLKIVHDQATNAALAELSPMKRRATQVIGPAFSAVDRRLWRRYRHVLVNSEETRRRAATAGLREAARMEVLRPGVDLARFGGDVDDTARTMTFLTAGRIMWQKHIELAIDALRLALDRRPGLSLIVAGAVDVKSEPYFADLCRRAEGLPVRCERDPDDGRLAELYRTSAALLFTPRNEDWGMVPLEAMASGLPVLAIDAGGPRESILDGRTGWLLPDDPEAFSEKVIAVASAPAGDLASMRAASRERAATFAWA